MASKQSQTTMSWFEGAGNPLFEHLSEMASPHSVCSSGELAARPAAPGRIGGIP